ncbi:MAG: hypothetical protein DRN53_08290 [Thermoprotei archaeon]|nr:MAG: hypothetical protein DRN53_08290 [Thermoprotei archaeon]
MKVIDIAWKPSEIAEAISTIIEKLAGRGSDLVLTLEDLTLDIAGRAIKISGKIRLDVTYVRESKE